MIYVEIVAYHSLMVQSWKMFRPIAESHSPMGATYHHCHCHPDVTRAHDWAPTIPGPILLSFSAQFGMMQGHSRSSKRFKIVFHEHHHHQFLAYASSQKLKQSFLLLWTRRALNCMYLADVKTPSLIF